MVPSATSCPTPLAAVAGLIRWKTASSFVEGLEMTSGAAADAAPWLASAAALLESARREIENNPEAAFVLAYDAARKACTALLAQQGLRTKGTSHHVTVERVVRAQFAGPFDAFGALRRRRNEIEYPQRPGEALDPGEAPDAITQADAIVTAATRLVPQLTPFH